MGRTIESFSHTGDVGFALSADDLDDLFDAAREALLQVLVATPPEHGDDERTVELTAPGLDVLLVRWLEEILYLHATEALLAASAGPRVQHRDDGWHLAARVRLAPMAPDAHGSWREVKAVTYHGLEVTRDEAGWHARVVLDV
ncbi:MAG: archease [Trueperaceae bacterium]